MGAFDHLPYRRGVGIMLLNARGKVFVAKRIDMTSEAWQMPQGGIDDGEDPQTAALRELKEETGTDKAEIIADSGEWLRYDLPDALVPKLWKGRYRGQEQLWYVMRFTGQDSDIDIATDH
ncbi:MAG: RNA pyrophosphohydrolase, partial [Azospirillum brasilense]